MTIALSRTTALRAASVVTALNVLVASGFSIAGLVDPQSILPAGDAPSDASLVLALYAAARTIPLALFALWAIVRRAASALLILGALACVVQALDAGIGLVQHDVGKTLGPLAIAALQLVALLMLKRSMAGEPAK
jgi:hypothetical protein